MKITTGLCFLFFSAVLCQNISKKLEEEFSSGVCEVKCLNNTNKTENCRKYNCPCKNSTDVVAVYNRSQDMQVPEPTLLCRDEQLIRIVWDNLGEDVLYLLEVRSNTSEWIFVDKTICHSITVAHLAANSTYQVRLWAITKNGQVYGPTYSTWITTYPLKYTPLPIAELNLTDIYVEETTFTAVLKWAPAQDTACFYHFLFAWEEDGSNLIEREITDIDDLFHIEINKIPFDTNFTVAAMSKSKDMRRESNQTWLSFVTPTCLEVLRNLVQCAPQKPQNLTTEQELVETSSNSEIPVYNVKVNWRKPELIPDYYMVYVLYNSTHVFQNISGNETSAYFEKLPLGVQYNIFVKAFSTGGETASDIMEIPLQLNIVVSSSMPITVGSVTVVLTTAVVIIVLFFKNKLCRKCKKQRAVDTLPHVTVQATKEKYFSSENRPPGDGYYTPELVNDGWRLDSDNIVVDIAIGEGAFGIVHKGTLKNNEGDTPVAIKMLKGTSTMDEIRQFQQEIEIMKYVGSHPHIVSILGCCSKPEYFGPLLVVEYCNKGDLQTFLRSIWNQISEQCTKSNYTNSVNSTQNDNTFTNKTYALFGDSVLEAKDLLSFGRQIALGMEFLSSLHVVHRDLAARNILMCGYRTLKIADFGLSRDVYEDNIYHKTGAGKLPVKWMAIESLVHQQYTTQSDVWSFGIVLWEIVTLGGNPYPTLSGKDLLEFLKTGYRMECPKSCNQDLYNLMLLCWRENAKERPSFSQLSEILEKFLENENHYINLDVGF